MSGGNKLNYPITIRFATATSEFGVIIIPSPFIFEKHPVIVCYLLPTFNISYSDIKSKRGAERVGVARVINVNNIITWKK